MSASRSGRAWRRLLTGLIGLTLVGASLAATPDTASAGTRHRYLVKTTAGSDVARPLAKARQSGGTVLTRLSRTMSGFTAELTPGQAGRLASDPSVTAVVADVAYTVDDQRVTANASQSGPPWGLDRIDQRTPALDGRYDYLTAGSGGTAFVIDSGIRLTHTQFGGRAVSGWDFVGGDANASDCAGHGTHVAGTIGGSTYGVAKGVRLVSVRVLDCSGSGYIIDMIDALEWVAAHKPAGPAVVNMSLGFEVTSATSTIAAYVDGAVNAVVKAGIPVVVAAGNSGEDGLSACSYSPARVPAAITVGASDDTDTRASFSNLGGCVDLYAPGVDVLSSWVSSNTAAGYLDGTSMASPHVAGAIARLQQDDPLASPAALAGQLLGRSTLGALTDADEVGTPNRLLFATPPAELAGVPTAVSAVTSDSRKTVTVRWSPPAGCADPDRLPGHPHRQPRHRWQGGGRGQRRDHHPQPHLHRAARRRQLRAPGAAHHFGRSGSGHWCERAAAGRARRAGHREGLVRQQEGQGRHCGRAVGQADVRRGGGELPGASGPGRQQQGQDRHGALDRSVGHHHGSGQEEEVPDPGPGDERGRYRLVVQGVGQGHRTLTGVRIRQRPTPGEGRPYPGSHPACRGPRRHHRRRSRSR